MEDTLRVLTYFSENGRFVLILVLMEDTLRVLNKAIIREYKQS